MCLNGKGIAFLNENTDGRMSRQNTRYILVFLAVAILSFQPNKTFAIQGTCSSHGGVNCSKFDSDGSAICNDGWVNSSVGFYSVDECNNCSSYLYHTGCRNKYDLDAIGEDYGQRGLTFSGMRIAAEDKCNAEIQDYEGKQAKYQQCMNLRDESARVWSSHLDAKLAQLLQQVNTIPQCPPNSSYSSVTDNCPCISGYVVNGGECIPATSACKIKLGLNSYGDTQHCYCSSGYQFNGAGTSCVQIPQTIIRSQSSYPPPQPPSSPDPIELCIQKLGPYGIVAGQNLCGCVQGYILNEAKNSCVQQPVEIKPSLIRETPEPDIFTEFIKDNVKKPLPEVTTKKDAEQKISSEPQESNVVGITSPSVVSTTSNKADVRQKQSLVKRLGSWFKSLFR